MDSRQESRWPAASMLLFGAFGSKTPEGRRYYRRCYTALLLAVVLQSAGFLFRDVVPRVGIVLIAVTPGLGFTYIAWEIHRYTMALDELARRIQLEAMAWTYLTGMSVATIVGGLLLAFGTQFRRFG